MSNEWADRGYALTCEAEQLWQRVKSLTALEQLDMPGISAVADARGSLSDRRAAWLKANQSQGTNGRDGGKLHLLNAATYGIEEAIEALWCCRVLDLLGDDRQKQLVPDGLQLTTALHDNCWGNARQAAQSRKVKPGPGISQWANQILAIATSENLTTLPAEAYKLGGLPEAWQFPFTVGQP